MQPTVTGPITGGAHGWPFAAATFDLDAAGYVEEEWFISGTATTYRHAEGSDRSWDGRWTVEPGDTLPYTTRLLVRRPIDPARTNGTAVLMWNNVSLGFDLFAGESPEIYDGGFIFVAVSAQPDGVHGFSGGSSRGLLVWDEERYGGLSVPANSASFDIYTDAARLIRSGELGVAADRVLGLGASQSAMYLATYLNAVQPLTAALDGLILEIYFGNAAPIDGLPPGEIATDPAAIAKVVAGLPPGAHLLRDDLPVRVMVLNSETEATNFHPVRRPDGDRFRLWEVAGTSHAPRVRGTPRLPSNLTRDLGIEDLSAGVPADANAVGWEPVRSAALRQMHRWLTGGAPPPIQPRIEFDDGPVIRRDDLGLAVGGIRLPEIAAPRARHSGLAADGVLSLNGSTTQFTPAVLSRLYTDAADYERRWHEAVVAGVAAGFIREEDAAGYRPPQA